MNRRTLKIGIMPRPQFQAYTIAIAKGEYKPRPDEPKIWFESLHALGQVLSEKNQALHWESSSKINLIPSKI